MWNNGKAYKGFHSSRHTFVSTLLNNDVPETLIAPIVSHEGMLISSKVYWNVKDSAKRKPIIEKFKPHHDLWKLMPNFEDIKKTDECRSGNQMKNINIDSVRLALDNCDFSDLIGEFENDWLECKGQPYDLNREDQKLELAKDVSGLANAGGGLLILGYSTKSSVINGEDQIHEVRAFPEDRFLQKQYESVITTWIYPPIEGLKIRRHYVAHNPSSIVVSLDVPKVEGPNSPALVAKCILDNSRKVQSLVGYFVRKQSHVAHYDIKRIQALFRDGLRYDDDIRDNFSTLHSAIESLRGQKSIQSAAISNEEVNRSVNKALAVVDLLERPSISISAVPNRTLNLTGIFESDSSDLVRLIESPPEVRSMGFNLRTGERSKIIEGKIRRTVEIGYRLIEVHRNGLVVFISDGGENGLCWGRPARQEQNFLINQIALIEYVYLFCLLINSIYSQQIEDNDKISLRAKILNLTRNGNPPKLESGYPDQFGFSARFKSAPDSPSEFTCDFDHTTTPERAAFLLLAEIYAWFGIETDKIPLTTQDENKNRILDRVALQNVR